MVSLCKYNSVEQNENGTEQNRTGYNGTGTKHLDLLKYRTSHKYVSANRLAAIQLLAGDSDACTVLP